MPRGRTKLIGPLMPKGGSRALNTKKTPWFKKSCLSNDGFKSTVRR